MFERMQQTRANEKGPGGCRAGALCSLHVAVALGEAGSLAASALH